MEAGELEALQEEVKRLQNSGKIMTAVNSAHEYLDSERGILDNLAAAKDQLAAVVRYDERLHNACESLEGSWIALDECRRELSDYLSREEYDAARAAYVEERLDLWYRLQKKYGDSYEAITAYLGQAQQQADELAQLESNIAKTKQLLAQQKVNWNSRRKAYRSCALNMPGGWHLKLRYISMIWRCRKAGLRSR